MENFEGALEWSVRCISLADVDLQQTGLEASFRLLTEMADRLGDEALSTCWQRVTDAELPNFIRARLYAVRAYAAFASRNIKGASDWIVRCFSLFDTFPNSVVLSGPLQLLAEIADQGGMKEIELSWDEIIGGPLPNEILEGLNHFVEAKRNEEDSRKFAFFHHGTTMDMVKRYSEAIRFYDESLKIDPDFVHALSARAKAFFSLGQYEDAVADCDRVIRISPDTPESHRVRGISLSELGRFAEALPSFMKVLEIEPDEACGYYDIACFYSLKGDTDLALDNLLKAIDIDPEYKEQAKSDHTLESIRNNAKFRALIFN